MCMEVDKQKVNLFTIITDIRQLTDVYELTFLGEQCEMMVSPIRQTKVMNEANICRYLMRISGDYPTDPSSATLLDQRLDMAASITNGSNVEKSTTLAQIAKQLTASKFIAGNIAGVEDFLVNAAFTKSVTSGKWSTDVNLKKWSSSLLSCVQ